MNGEQEKREEKRGEEENRGSSHVVAKPLVAVHLDAREVPLIIEFGASARPFEIGGVPSRLGVGERHVFDVKIHTSASGVVGRRACVDDEQLAVSVNRVSPRADCRPRLAFGVGPIEAHHPCARQGPGPRVSARRQRTLSARLCRVVAGFNLAQLDDRAPVCLLRGGPADRQLGQDDRGIRRFELSLDFLLHLRDPHPQQHENGEPCEPCQNGEDPCQRASAVRFALQAANFVDERVHLEEFAGLDACVLEQALLRFDGCDH